MLFNSHFYIFFFLPLTFAVYFILNKWRLALPAKSWLVFCSLFFYSYWDVRYLPLILLSILFNYSVGTALVRHGPSRPSLRLSRKQILYVGVICNLFLLGYYKYADFFLSNLTLVTGIRFTLLKVVLPLGISFFTFTQIAYLVDCYRGECREYDLLNYSLFVTYFPHLIAGPILHHKDLMPQFDRVRGKVIDTGNLAVGLYIFSIGLFKKVIIADTFAVWATGGFDHSAFLGFWDAWIAALSYSFQLYFDFSGYIDMAVGSSLFFNIRLPVNFFSPYKALDIQDFWRRWHITLSRFLRDYLYIPLGGNRRGEVRTYLNLFMTFLIGGLWHGASWTFVLWGALHGFAMVAHRLWTRTKLRMHRLLAWFLTFNFVTVAWVFFRAKTWGDAVKVLRGMSGLAGFSPGFYGILDSKKKVLALVVIACVVFLAKNSVEMQKDFRPNWKNAVFCLLVFAAGLIGLTRVSEFIYFNF